MSLEDAAQLAILISSEVVAQFGPRLDVENYAKLLKNFQLNVHKYGKNLHD
jgi:sugar/nucleoside kinase (ribokinase family)